MCDTRCATLRVAQLAVWCDFLLRLGAEFLDISLVGG